MQKIRKNDEVVIITGSHKGQTGKVLSVNKKKNTVTVDKINVVKKHTKPTQNNPEGGVITFEAPIHISNVALHVKGKKAKENAGASKVGVKVDDKGNKTRVAKLTGKEV